MLTIWGRANSINVQKVMWTIAELDLLHVRKDAGMAFGVVDQPWFRSLNPNGLVPTLEDNGIVLWESNVIVRYLAEKYGTGSMMPSDPVARAKAEIWMDWQQNSIMPAMSPLFLGLVRTPPEKRDLNRIETGRTEVEAAMRLLDAHLDSREFVTGDDLTIGDIPLGCVVYRWYALPIEHPRLANLSAWYDRLKVRPAFAKHVMLPLT